jgi:3-hydroxyisobutyrate dehydrogenase
MNGTGAASEITDLKIGFAGLGRMGLPMVRRLLDADYEVQVWNRSGFARDEARAAGADSAETLADLFEANAIILLALANERVSAELLQCGDSHLCVPMAGRTLIQLGTTSPGYSQSLRDAVVCAGGHFIEAPVSGSRKPAEEGTLIGMIGAESDPEFALAEQILAPLTTQAFRCGAPPAAMTMKLAVNSFLIAMVMSLAESWSLARRLALDLDLFRSILDAGPMASAVSRGKLAKLIAGDMAAQASIADVLMNARLLAGLADGVHVPLPLGRASERMLARAAAAGLGGEDMIAAEKLADRS